MLNGSKSQRQVRDMSTPTRISQKEEKHRFLVSTMIDALSDDEVQGDMKDTALTYRQLRTSLLLSLNQMKQIHDDFGWEDDSNLTALRDIIASVREEEMAVHEMISSQCEFDDKAAMSKEQALTEIGASLMRIEGITESIKHQNAGA